MIDKIWRSIQDASGTLLQQADQLGKGARERAEELIEDWVAIFPLLEKEGLTISSFAMGLSINPSLEVEFAGKHEDFTFQRLDYLAHKYRTNTLVISVLKTIRTAYRLHERMSSPLHEPLIVQIKIRLSPEVKVYLGKPIVE